MEGEELELPRVGCATYNEWLRLTIGGAAYDLRHYRGSWEWYDPQRRRLVWTGSLQEVLRNVYLLWITGNSGQPLLCRELLKLQIPARVAEFKIPTVA